METPSDVKRSASTNKKAKRTSVSNPCLDKKEKTEEYEAGLENFSMFSLQIGHSMCHNFG